MTFSDGVDYTLALALFSFHPVEEVHSPLEASIAVLAEVEVDAVAFVLVTAGSTPGVEVVAEGMAAVVAGMVVEVDLEVDARVVVADEHQDEQIAVVEHQVEVAASPQVGHLLEVADVVVEENSELVGLVADAERLDPVEVNMIALVVV
jgi:uncharacterized membrane protein